MLSLVLRRGCLSHCTRKFRRAGKCQQDQDLKVHLGTNWKVSRKVVVQLPVLKASEPQIALRYAILFGGPWILQSDSATRIRCMAPARVGAVTISLHISGSKDEVTVVPDSTWLLESECYTTFLGGVRTQVSTRSQSALRK